MSQNTRSVLIVDDQPKIGALVVEIFHRLGFNDALACANANEALDIIKAHPVNLIVCDLDLTPVDGLHLLREVRSHEKLFNTAFILTETIITYEQVTTAHNLGVDAFLLKPFDIPLLKSKLKSIMNRSGKRRHIVTNWQLGDTITAA